MAKGDRHRTVDQHNLIVDLVKVEKKTGIPNCKISRIIGRFKKFGTTVSSEGQGAIRQLLPLIVIYYKSKRINSSLQKI